jgi:hypothetical protein
LLAGQKTQRSRFKRCCPMAHSPRSTLPKAEHDAKEQQSAMEALLLDAEQREERCTACGHERICSRRRPVICPSGVLLKGLSIPLCKNISVFTPPKSLLELLASHPTQRGVSRSSRTRGADAVDAAASCVRRDCRAGDEPVSDRQHADERCCQRTAKSCGPDAPTLASSSRMLCRPYRA